MPLARALRGHVPTHVEEGQVRSTHDTPENRFVKTFLAQALGIVDGMRRVVGRTDNPTAFHRRILGECDAMEQALHPIVRDPFWTGVGTMARVPVASTILQRRRGYREVFAHFSRLRLAARVPLDRELVPTLLETKDIAELYELWCYFTLVEAVARLLGPPAPAGRPRADALALTVSRAFEIAWADGTRLLYNASFSRSGPSARRSYSVPLRPDVALELPDGPNAGLHLLDAKFRLDRVDLLTSDGAGDDEVAEERRGTFKRGDLYKMHAYRDAIGRTSSVWILYPGTDLRFFSEYGPSARTTSDLPARLDGVGAIPLRPEDGGTVALIEVVAHLLWPGRGIQPKFR